MKYKTEAVKNNIIDRSLLNVSCHDYHHGNSLHLLKLSYAAYAGTLDGIAAKKDCSITEKFVADAGYQMKRIETRRGIYAPNAIIVWDDTDIIIAFQGIEPTAWNQWATDIHLFKKPFCTGEAHRGFVNSVELIWPAIMKCLQTLYVSKRERVFVTGHSLGAGMSQVASAKLMFEEGIRPAAVYNFGCPRALSSEGVRIYNEQLGDCTYRVVNNNDIVCMLPPEIMGFSHVGQFKYISSQGELLDNPEFWLVLRDGLRSSIKALAKLNPISGLTNHHPLAYIKSLEKLNTQ